MFEISEVEFGFDEEYVNLYEEGHDVAGFYERIGEIDKPLNAVRKLAEIKRYLEARNVSLIEKAETD
jgi:hypothetical protein